MTGPNEAIEANEPNEGDPMGVVRAEDLYHTGIVVEDLDASMAQLTDLAGHGWMAPIAYPVPVWTPAGESTVPLPMVYSLDFAYHATPGGDFHFCATLLQTALGMTAPGGMSERFRVPRRALTVLPAGLDVRDACLVEPGSVAWHACALAGVGPGTRVAVVGAGAIGILAAAAAQAMGAAEVSVEARHPHQQAARDQLGATVPHGLYDVVVETAGSDSALHRAIDLARHRGTVVYAGIFEDTKLPHGEMALKEVALRPSLGYCGHGGGGRQSEQVAAMLAARPELADLLISRRFPIEDAPAAFAAAQDRSSGIFRVVVEP